MSDSTANPAGLTDRQKRAIPLTEEQMRLWEKLASKKLPATEIYQQIFGGTTGAKVFSKVKEDFRKWQMAKLIN